ncbi:MAG: VWA domain-containing protein [Candidatus Bathyarchaeia archaeon]
MGYLEYAWDISLQKDNMKLKMVINPLINQPTLEPDTFGFTANFPAVNTVDDKHISFLGYKFTSDADGKAKIGKLFRAAVTHLTAHTVLPLPANKIAPLFSSEPVISIFAKSLAADACANAYIQASCPERIADLAYANALSFAKIKLSERILMPSTRIMAALLSKVNIGIIKGSLTSEFENTVNDLYDKLLRLRNTFLASIKGAQINIEKLFDDTVKSVIDGLEPFGPFLEAPSLPYTEQTGPCSVFAGTELATDLVDNAFLKSIETLGGTVPTGEAISSLWRKEQEIEALQAFDSEQHQKMRRQKILDRLNQYARSTRFKEVSFPDEDYTEYLRARRFLQGGSRRLLDSLRVAQDALDEDPGKEMGQMDLTAVIQAIASKKPATDVFFKDEYLSRSFAWSILFDASTSMQLKGQYAKALLICVAEATKELLMDPGAWTLFAFSDKFYVLKDSTEAYTRKVQARIGGLKFGGLTYMPDAMRLAGQILASRFDEQRVLVVISDGWPYGYDNVTAALAGCIHSLVKKGIIVIGIGVETERMGNFFRLNAAVYTQKDLVKRFAKIFVDASAAALET